MISGAGGFHDRKPDFTAPENVLKVWRACQAWHDSRGEFPDAAVSRPRVLENGAIAQLGERLNGIQEVGGSTPPGSTKKYSKVLKRQVNFYVIYGLCTPLCPQSPTEGPW
jgi:hypothetical protein